MTQNQYAARCRKLPWQTMILGLAFMSALAGCGRGEQAAVTGKVTYMGEPVHSGTLIFGPIGDGNVGQPASAVIKQDGTFVLGTNSASDGALIGRHRISYTPAPVELTDQQRMDPTYIAPPPAYVGMIPKEAEVDVKAGKNAIAIELVVAPQ